MATALTILDHKLAFLRQQIATLSRPASIPATFAARQPETLTAAEVLGQRNIDEALAALNLQIRKHSKLVYSGPALRHVGEQIDALYWAAGERDIRTGRFGAGAGEGGVERGVDLAATEVVETLPEKWDAEVDGPDGAEPTEHYAALVERMKGLDAQRKVLREKVARYTALKEALSPFENPVVDVQPNICTRNGELELELEKMRSLVARVVGRMAGLDPESGTSHDVEVVDVDDVDEDQKIKALLAMS